jgi:hypothetical protein
VWGSPTVAGDLVYVGLGNSRINDPAANPAGALLCLRAGDGSEVFRFQTGDSVLTQPVVDAYQLYFGSNDGTLYCLNRKTGKQCWQYEMGSEVIATPLLVPAPSSEAPWRIHVVGFLGQMACLEPVTGKVAWSRDLRADVAPELQLMSPLALEEPKDGLGPRRFYVAASVASTGRSAVLCCYELGP